MKREHIMSNYAHPEMLVSTEWVAAHGADASVRLLEVDVDTEAYSEGHIPGAVGVNWTSQLCDNVRRDVLTKTQFEELCSKSGITPETTVVFYGDNNNWFACYALWQFTLYGHEASRLKIMNGGRNRWLTESRPLTTDVPTINPTPYSAKSPDPKVRAMRDDVFAHLDDGLHNLVDVRSPAEFSGEVIAPPGMNETAQRGGHIPGASSIPWAMAVKEDGTFKSYEELRNLYLHRGVDLSADTIVYCRIGERSSHSWFVLKYLLGVENCRNYDGSWTEWGNLVGAPIEKA